MVGRKQKMFRLGAQLHKRCRRVACVTLLMCGMIGLGGHRGKVSRVPWRGRGQADEDASLLLQGRIVAEW